jgi:hypothetical protein
LYTFVALIAVSSLLVFSFMAYADTIRGASEAKQLKNLMDCASAKATELITLVSTTNATTEAYLQMPTAIGNKQYWLQLQNDSSEAWLEGGLGNVPVEGAKLRVYLPKEAIATGHYLGGYGAARFTCTVNVGVPSITLTSSGEGV